MYGWSVRRSDRDGWGYSFAGGVSTDFSAGRGSWPTDIHRWVESGSGYQIEFARGRRRTVLPLRVVARPDGLTGIVFDAGDFWGKGSMDDPPHRDRIAVLNFPSRHHPDLKAITFYLYDETSIDHIEIVVRSVAFGATKPIPLTTPTPEPDPLGDGGPAIEASIAAGALVRDSAGNLYVAGGDRIRKIRPDGIITTIAGGGDAKPGDGGRATEAAIIPWGIVADAAGNVYFADAETFRVRKVGTNGIISTVAGGGSANPGDGGRATDASLGQPTDIAFDQNGNLYIAEGQGYRIRIVTPDGTIDTHAGTGKPGFSGDGGPASEAQISWIEGMTVDVDGNVLFSDTTNNRVRRIDASTRVITTIAGGGPAPSPPTGYCESGGDGGPATQGFLCGPKGISVDSAGNILFSDASANRIRRIDTSGVITTVAGSTSDPGFGGDGGPATSARLTQPFDVLCLTGGGFLISDSGNQRVRRVDASGTITTIAGRG